MHEPYHSQYWRIDEKPQSMLCSSSHIALGNIIGPFAFKTKEAPVDLSGITANLIAYCVEIVVLGLR